MKNKVKWCCVDSFGADIKCFSSYQKAKLYGMNKLFFFRLKERQI